MPARIRFSVRTGSHRPILRKILYVIGKTHLAIAIARSCIRGGSRGRFYTVVDLVNRRETETRKAGRAGLPIT
jgi:hypothetical protein